MNREILWLVLAILSVMPLLVVSGSNDEKKADSRPYLGQSPLGLEPQLLAPDLFPTDGVQHCFPAFSPDGMEVFWMHIVFTEGERPRGEILFMRNADDGWSPPQVAPFSGEYSDHAPVFSQDGKRLYFSSSRPGGGDGRINLWFVVRAGTEWTAPKPLGSPPNSELGATQATFAANGTVYFVGRYDDTQWNRAIYRSEFVDGAYQKPEAIQEPIRTPHADIYPYIAPDESYLIFGSTRPGGNSIESDLYISFRDSSGAWGDPIHMNASINNGASVSFPFVTHDGKYLMFNRFDLGANGKEDSTSTDRFYWVDAGIIEEHRPAAQSEKGE